MAITKINTPEIFDLGTTNSSLRLPSGNTASRPTSASAGEWRYNTDDNKVEYYDGSDWFQVDDEALPLPANFPGLNFNTNTYVGTGATQTIDAKFNEAAVFNGSSSSISTDVIPLSGTSFSISSWVYRNTNNTVSIIFGQSDQSNGTPFLSIGFDTNNNLELLNRNASSTGLDLYLNSTTHGVGINAWYNIVWTCSATESKLYVNGVLKDTTSFTANNYSFSSQYIGARMRTTGVTNNWNGKLDQVRIFNTALTQQQVTDLYNNETTTTAGTLNFPTGAGCIAAYQLDGDASDVGGTYGGVPTDIGYTGLQFQPNFVWIKDRDAAYSHQLYDTVRGATKKLHSNTTAAESTDSTGLTAFDSNGFTISTNVGINTNNNDYVGWCWKAGGAAVSNTDGTITSQVSANKDSGFSIIKTAGGNSGASTVGHGLNYAPEMVITKGIDNSAYWWIYHSHLNGGVNPEQYGVRFSLNGDSAKYDASSGNLWNNTAPTNSVISLGPSTVTNPIIYAFHSVSGYSKIGSYTGGTANKVVETNFEPAWILIKGADSSTADHWVIYDNKRSPTNPMDELLLPNLSDAENANNTNHQINFLSNGFQLITTSTQTNASGGDYIYLAIAADAQPAPVLADSFQPVIYTGNGGTQSIATDFQPDLVWAKYRDITHDFALIDSVRGVGKVIRSNKTIAEQTFSDTITSFDSNGFTVGSDSEWFVNRSGANYVAWCWKAAGISSINTEGSITSLTNANPAAGFSIVKYTGTTNIGTVGHGLTQAPEMIIIKNLQNSSAARHWAIYHSGVDANSENFFLRFTTNSKFDLPIWNDTAPTSTVFTLGDNTQAADANDADNHIAYCFHSVDGYQKVGSYTGGGEGSSNEITTGFKPRWVMVKRTDNTGTWRIYDHLRGVTNDTTSLNLSADSSGAESTPSSAWEITFADTGFYWGTGSNVKGSINATGGTYIYLAIK